MNLKKGMNQDKRMNRDKRINRDKGMSQDIGMTLLIENSARDLGPTGQGASFTLPVVGGA